MTEAEAREWTAANARYVAAAVAWVRALLHVRSPSPHPAPAPPPALPPPRRRWLTRRGTVLPPAETEPVDALMTPAAALKQMETIEAGMLPPPALSVLTQRLGLSLFERNVLLLCAALELDTSIAGLCARAQGDPARPYPTFALALSLFCDPAWDALSPERPLRQWRLVELSAHEALALTSSPLRADERAVNFIKGVTYLDDRLTPLLTPLPDLVEDATPSQHQAAAELLRQLKSLPSDHDAAAVQLIGPDAVSKQIVAGLICRALGRRAWRLDLNQFPQSPNELDQFSRLWQRETLLLPVVLYFDTDVAETTAAPIDRLLARLPGIVFLATRHLWPGLSRLPVAVEVSRPQPDEQEAIWDDALGAGNDVLAAALAGQFSLNGWTIRALAAREQGGRPETLHARLWDACRAVSRPQLDTLARRLIPKVQWDDIVLPPTELALLHQIADQVGQRRRVYRDWGFAERMTRGLGLSVLFAGPPGSGKTMAAEVLANALQLDLFRIDLSGVISRWLGETEANLRRLFDAAEEGGAILFFDEADALFGKRTEVKDSHDRYANIEINYLLQRMESFGGLAILATNMKSALDNAFLRRLRFVLDFPFPGVAERRAMWQRVFPPQTPVRDLDFDRLAKLNVTGGHIAVIALNAAFQAAQAGTPVTMAMLFNAARIELRKLGRPINEADLRVATA